MNTTKKLILLVFSIAFVFSCSKNDEDSSNLSTETIEIEGDLKINFDDLTVVTIDGESDVDKDGGFQAIITNTIADELPILFLKDNEIMFGYYSKTGLNNTVSIDDILLFYFTLHPEIALLGLKNSELLAKIKQNSNYSELASLVKSSLNANKSPFDNASFVSLINASGLGIGVEGRDLKQAKSSKVNEFDFKYTYSRDGTIIWDKKFPLFATVGMEVIDASTGISVSGPQIFDRKGLVLGLGSMAEWLYDYLTTEESENIGTFKLPNEGQYEIKFTNGVDNFGSKSLESKVDLINRFNIGVNVLSIVMPIGIKKWLGENDCRDALIDIFKNLKLTPAELVITDKIAMDKFVKDVAKDTYTAAVKCIPSVEKKYLDYILSITEEFNKIEEASNFYLLLRDYVFSDIQGWETRYYYDGVSFGELELTNTSGLEFITPTGTEFSGEVKSEHTYSAIVNETTFKYSIDRSPIQSIITSAPANEEYAIGLPFDIKKINSGDATLKENNINSTNIEGKLSTTFIMGEQESIFEIKPAFKNSGLALELVNLKQIESICIYKEAFAGNWMYRESVTQNGVYGGANEYFINFDMYGNGKVIRTRHHTTSGDDWIWLENNDYPDHDYFDYTLCYNDNKKELVFTNLYWSSGYSFPANSIDDTYFETTLYLDYGMVYKLELFRQ